MPPDWGGGLVVRIDFGGAIALGGIVDAPFEDAVLGHKLVVVLGILDPVSDEQRGWLFFRGGLGQGLHMGLVPVVVGLVFETPDELQVSLATLHHWVSL